MFDKTMTIIYAAAVMLMAVSLSGCSSGSNDAEALSTRPYRVDVRSSLKVRTGPGTQYQAIGQLFNDETADVISTGHGDGEWVCIWYHGQRAYASASYLTPVGEPAPEVDAVVHEPPTSVEPAAAPSAVAQSVVPMPEPDPALQSADGDTTAAKGQVIVCDPAGFLSPGERVAIESYPVKSDACIVVSVASKPLTAREATSYNNHVVDSLRADPVIESLDKDELMVVSYIPSLRFLDYLSESNPVKMELNDSSRKFFELQTLARGGRVCEAIIRSIGILDNSVSGWQDSPWYLKTWKCICYYQEEGIDSLIVSNFLPNDTFLYKWVFSWLMWLPRHMAMMAFAIWPSLFGAMVVLMLLYGPLVGLLNYLEVMRGWKISNLFYIPYSLLIMASAICLSVMVTPGMLTVVQLEELGYSPEFVGDVMLWFGEGHIPSWWVMMLLMFTAFFLESFKGPQAVAASFLPPAIQRKMFSNLEQSGYLTLVLGLDETDDGDKSTLDLVRCAIEPMTGVRDYFAMRGSMKGVFMAAVSLILKGPLELSVLVLPLFKGVSFLFVALFNSLAYLRRGFYRSGPRFR